LGKEKKQLLGRQRGRAKGRKKKNFMWEGRKIAAQKEKVVSDEQEACT